MLDGNFFNSKSKGASQFWQGLQKVKHLFKWGALHKVGDGSLTAFWGDVWLGQSPLKTQFPDLFSICEDPVVLVADCWDHGEWTVNFRRSHSSREYTNWEELLGLLQNIDLDQEVRDDFTWALDSSKAFTTKSLYRFITHRGVCISASQDVWKTKLPLKIKIFLWQLQHNKLQMAASLKKRGSKGDVHCCLCGEVETTNHIFFGCSIARLTWCCLRDAFGWVGCVGLGATVLFI